MCVNISSLFQDNQQQLNNLLTSLPSFRTISNSWTMACVLTFLPSFKTTSSNYHNLISIHTKSKQKLTLPHGLFFSICPSQQITSGIVPSISHDKQHLCPQYLKNLLKQNINPTKWVWWKINHITLYNRLNLWTSSGKDIFIKSH